MPLSSVLTVVCSVGMPAWERSSSESLLSLTNKSLALDIDQHVTLNCC